MKVPQIENGSKGPCLHVSQILPLPTKTPWGNLTLKFFKIVQRIEYLNSRIVVVYQHYEEQKKSQAFPIDQCSLEIEEIVYWIRKTVDELIQILYVAYCWQHEGAYPEIIKVDSIGHYYKISRWIFILYSMAIM